jgi:predicted Zn-dependent protease with MMP-like domain
MSFDHYDVVTVVTAAFEVVGKYMISDSSDDTITLKDPRLVMATQKGMGLAPGVAMTGEGNPDKITLYNVICVMKTDSEVEKNYRSQVSGLVL